MMRKASLTLSPDERSAWAKLQRARPLVEWHKASLRSADFLGDGSLTCVMVGNDDEGGGFIGIVHSGREGGGNPGIFAIGSSIGLAFEKLERSEDWLFDGVFPLVGCRPRRGKSMLRVVDEDAATQTLYYWNGEQRCFSTWSTPLRKPAEPEPWADEALTG